MEYWQKLKNEIENVRSAGYENTDIVNMSETYFRMADKTVSAAERYSEKIAQNIRILEILSAIDMVFLILIIVQRSIFSIRITNWKRKLIWMYIQGLPTKAAARNISMMISLSMSQPQCSCTTLTI